MDKEKKKKRDRKKIIIMEKKKQGKPTFSLFLAMLFFALLTFQMTMKVQNLEAESEGKSVERFKKLIKTLSKISKFIISASFFTGIFWGFLTRSHQHRNPQRKYSH